MPLQVKVLNAKPEDLRVNPRIHIVEDDERFQVALTSTHPLWHKHRHTTINKCKTKRITERISLIFCHLNPHP